MGSNQHAGISYPVLNRSKFLAWSIKMKAAMEASEVWDVIDPRNSKALVDEKKDKMARSTIFNSIPEDTLFLVANQGIAREIWKALKDMFLGVDRVQEVRIQSLKKEFDRLKMKDNETIDDYKNKVGTIVNKIREFGENIEDSFVMKRILRSLSNKFLQIVSTIEQFADLKIMSVEELIRRLKAHEERTDVCKKMMSTYYS